MLRALVVGLGAMGVRHAEALGELGIVVVGGVDPAEAGRRRAQESVCFTGVPLYSSLEEALAHQTPDLLTVASTAPAHAEAIEKAIEAGVNLILAEKPLTTSLATAEHLRLISMKHGTRVAVNHQSRFLKRYQHIRSLIGTPEFGDLRSMSVFGADFGLAMNGIHFIEVFEWLCMERIEEVFGDAWPSRHQNPRGAQFQDYQGVLMGWTRSKRRLHVDCAYDMGHGISLAFGFERGKVVWDELSGRGFSWHRNQENSTLPSYRYGTPSEFREFDFEIEGLVEGTRKVLSALLADEGYPTVRDGESAMIALIGGIESTELGGRKIGTSEIPTNEGFQWA